MKTSVILVVVLYEVLSIGVVSWLIQKGKRSKGESQSDFALGGRSLGT